MNFFIILVVTLLVTIGWYASYRLLGTRSKLQQLDPAGTQQRLDWIKALRDLSFFFILYFVLSTVFLFIFALALAMLDPPNKSNFLDSFSQIVGSVAQDKGVLSPASIWGALAAFAGAAVSVGISQRVARGRAILDLGLRYYKALPLDVLMGLLLGPVLLALVFMFEKVTGLMVGNTAPSFDFGEIAKWLLISLAVGVAEELVVRGFILQTLNLAFDGTVAVVASSVFWGLAHLLNPNGSPLAAINIAFAGLIFAYAYALSGHLWLPIAFHFSWNFAEGALFGYPVSGFSMPAPLLQPLVEGPDAVTGGRFGPEGGLLGMAVLFVGGLLLYGWAKTRQPSTK